MPTLTFPSDLDKNLSSFIMFTPYRFRPSAVNAKANRSYKEVTNDSIVLPIPNSGIINGVENEWSPEEGLATGLSQMAKVKAIQGIKEKTGAIFQHLNKGAFINDYSSLAYGGTNFRTFSFSWNELIAPSEQDAINLNSIFKTFEYYSVPDYKGSLVRYPYMWEIHAVMMGDDGKFQEPIPIRYVVNTSMNFSYLTENKSVFRSGHSVSTSLELSFQELTRHNRSAVGR